MVRPYGQIEKIIFEHGESVLRKGGFVMPL
jgi:hypothetical protein